MLVPLGGGRGGRGREGEGEWRGREGEGRGGGQGEREEKREKEKRGRGEEKMGVDGKRTIHTKSHASECKGETKPSYSSTHNKVKHLDNVWVTELLHQLNLHEKVLLKPRSQMVQLNALYSNQIMRRTL